MGECNISGLTPGEIVLQWLILFFQDNTSHDLNSFEFLKKTWSHKFFQSNIYHCVFYKEGVDILVYVLDAMVISLTKEFC